MGDGVLGLPHVDLSAEGRAGVNGIIASRRLESNGGRCWVNGDMCGVEMRLMREERRSETRCSGAEVFVFVLES